MLRNDDLNAFDMDQTRISRNSHRTKALQALRSVTKYTPARVKAARYASLGYRSPCLFNTIPADLRNLTNVLVDKFKKELDKFLSMVTDEPQIPGYTTYRRADTNSIVDMVKLR